MDTLLIQVVAEVAPFPWATYAIAAGVVSASMVVLWAILVRIRRTSLVDVAWTVALGVLALVFAAVGPGWGPRRLLLAVLAGLWAIRLAGYLAHRLARDGEDGRYDAMREAVGSSEAAFFFGFFQLQAAAAIAFALPYLVIASDSRVGFRTLEWIGVGVWVLGLVGETIADDQLDRWRKDPANRGRTCRRGLWAWSRHPNYFFEWLMWVGYAAIAWHAPLGWIGAFGALGMLLMVLKVSGIPYTELQALRSRGDDYRRYQREVSALFPMPPRQSADMNSDPSR